MAVFCFFTVFWNTLVFTNLKMDLTEVWFTFYPRVNIASRAWLIYLFRVFDLTFSSSFKVSVKKRISVGFNGCVPG